jgi:hypothetical protein
MILVGWWQKLDDRSFIPLRSLVPQPRAVAGNGLAFSRTHHKQLAFEVLEKRLGDCVSESAMGVLGAAWPQPPRTASFRAAALKFFNILSKKFGLTEVRGAGLVKARWVIPASEF